MMADPLQIVASTADPAFATDEEGRVVIWNRAAEVLLGREAAEVLGRPCHEVVRGRDLYGNCFCHDGCALQDMVRRGKAIRSFEVDFEHDDGHRLRLGVWIIAVPGPRESQYSLIHLLRPAGEAVRGPPDAPTELAAREPPRQPSPTASEDAGALTARETEILRVLADGWSTQEIADRLYISVATVRNHVQSILQKLDVHSRVEAVSLALRERII